MDNDFTLVSIIAGIIIGSIVLLVWMKSRGSRRVVKTITQAQDALKLTPFCWHTPAIGCCMVCSSRPSFQPDH